jgi:hypothetical protein
VQTLNPTLFLCFAPADRGLAERIAAFIERGAGVRVLLDAGEMLASEDLAEKARQAQGSDMALVLFSRASLPSRWPRAQWEDALVNEPAAEEMRIAFVKCDDCAPPRVLVPLFEANAFRAIKRWVRGHLPPPYTGAPRDPDLEVLGIAIADRPGTESIAESVAGDSGASVAERFIHVYQQDFDAILSVDCGERSLAALAGDLAAQLGLRLEGDAESNLARLQDFCAARRFLVVLKDLRTPAFAFAGRTSTLIVSGAVTEPADESIRGIQNALRHPMGGWIEFCRLARIGRRLTRDAGRIAECYEIVHCWHEAAQVIGDRTVLDESARELVWILLSWDRADEARDLDYRRACEFDEQMVLPF